MRLRFTTGTALTAGLTAGLLALAGCGAATGGPSPASNPGAQAAAQAVPRAATDPTALTKCRDGLSQVASFEPTQSKSSYLANDPAIARIRKKNQLIAGTSGDVLLWGARNAENGRLEGFDIQLLDMIAKEIGVKPTLKVINYNQRIPAASGQEVNGISAPKVDIVAHTMTINCTRWSQISFSSEYYRAGQKVLVRYNPLGTARDPLALNGDGAPLANSLSDLKGQKVCAANGSTNIDNLKTANDEGNLGIQTVAVDDLGDCLVKFQRGEVDAITGDDTVLAGFQAQDETYSRVVGDQFSAEPYGLGFDKADTGLVEFVNLLLDGWRRDGTLAAMAEKWLKGTAVAIPAAVYGRTGNDTKVS